MSLKLTLKPDEKVIIGGAVIKNGKSPIEFYIENHVPILRQKDIITERDADTLCKKIYHVIQLMYIDEPDLARYYKIYSELVKELVKVLPRAVLIIDEISEMIISNRYYKALKKAKSLIELEKEVIDNYVKNKRPQETAD